MSEMRPLYRMLRDVSRTFALSIEQLPRGPRDALTLGYLLLRVSDGLEDYPELPAPRKAELLRLWERVLRGDAPAAELIAHARLLDHRNPEVRVALQAETLLRHTHAQPPAVRVPLLHYVRQTTLGMARWQEQGPIVQTEAELDDYMHQVAGIVGYLITDVFAASVPRSPSAGTPCCCSRASSGSGCRPSTSSADCAAISSAAGSSCRRATTRRSG
jgi:farnesyl-diphosphate farnesyltransferase